LSVSSGFASDLGTLVGGDRSEAHDINASDEVVGSSTISTGLNRAAVWREGQATIDLGMLADASESYAVAVNDGGEVAGYSLYATFGSGPTAHATLSVPGHPIQDLGVLPNYDGSYAEDINSSAQVVGYARSSVGIHQAFVWSPGTGMTAISGIGSASEARAINDAGQIVGYATGKAFIWSADEGVRYLGTLGGASSVATDINAAGVVVGNSATSSGEYHAFLWSAGSGMQDLGTLGGTSSTANAINGDGYVVGYSTTGDGQTHAFLWTPTDGMEDISAVSGMTIAYAINDAMEVVGYSAQSHHAVLAKLDFTPSTPGALTTWDATENFSATRNPNGAWSAGWTPSLGGGLTLFPTTTSLADGVLTAWIDQSINLYNTPILGRNRSSTVFQGIAPGQLSLHPGCHAGEVAVLRWTASSAGSYGVTGQFFAGDIGDMSAYVLENSNATTPLFSALSTDDNPTFHLNVQLAAGDYIDFAVANGPAGCLNGSTPLEVSIGPGNSSPTASTGGPYVGAEGSSISLAFSASDPDGDALNYSWDLGDGTTASGATPPSAHTYADNGSYDISLTVSDGKGGSVTETSTATISNAAPTATWSPPAEVNEGSSISLSLTAPSDAAADLTTLQYAFDCGGGDGYGAFGATNSASCATTDNGSRTVKAKVKDKDGGETEYTGSVTIKNVPPTVTGFTVPAQVTLVGGSTTAAVTGITYTDPGSADGPFVTIIQCGNGPASASGICTYTAVGSYTVSVTVTDKDGGVSTAATHTVQVIYNFSGFRDPINGEVLNLVKAGGAVPIKFSLGGDQGLDILAALPSSVSMACSSSLALEMPEDVMTAGQSGLQYDPTTDEYTYIWKTSRSWSGQCRMLNLKLHDGTTYQANFKFK
jgi:probable HAF family extracellular repeat protein